MLNFKTFINSLSKEVVYRFPFVFVFILISFIFAIFENHQIFYFEKQLQHKLLFSSSILIVFTTSFYLFFERIKRNYLYKIVVLLVLVLFTYCSVFIYFDSIFFYFAAVLLSLTFSNFLFTNSTNQAILYFYLEGKYSILMAFFSCLILGLGISAIILSLEFLFNITFLNNYIEDVYTFIVIIIFPTLILSNIPKNMDILKEDIKLKTIWLILIKNILIPLLYIYTIILYAYFIKITILQELPKGDLSWIICMFLTLCIFVKIFLTSIKQQNLLVNFFDKYFIYSMLIPLIFLNIAIYTRVNEYGITQQRYALILLSIWFSSIVIYYFIKKEFSIKRSFIFLFLLLLISSVTPFGALNTSINSQVNRLETILKDNGILVENKIIPLTKQLERKKEIEISSIIKYLNKSKEGKKRLNFLFNTDFKNSLEFFKYLNIKYSNLNSLNSLYIKRFNLKDIVYNLEGYNYMIPLSIIEQKQKKYFYENKVVILILKNSILKLKIENQNIQFDLKQIVKEWKKQKIEVLDKNNYKSAIFYKKINNLELKLCIDYLDITKKFKDFEVIYLRGYLMIR